MSQCHDSVNPSFDLSDPDRNRKGQQMPAAALFPSSSLKVASAFPGQLATTSSRRRERQTGGFRAGASAVTRDFSRTITTRGIEALAAGLRAARSCTLALANTCNVADCSVGYEHAPQ